MRALVALSIVLAAIGLAPLASAQMRVMAAHDQTAAALECLLNADRKDCKYDFVGSAGVAARPWLWWEIGQRDFKLGALVSAEYAGTQSANAYTTRFLNGRTADVYGVKFRHQEKTFYIVPPGPDGKIQYMLIRSGAPNDERREGSVSSRIR